MPEHNSHTLFKKTLTQSLLIFALAACGGGGGESSSSKLPTNILPIADAGIDITVEEQEVVTLQGNGTDSDGSISSYSWTQSAGTSVILSDPNASSVSFTAPDIVNDETLIFSLTVTDDDGSKGTDSIAVNLTHLNAAPIVFAGENIEAMEGDNVALIATANDIDSSNLTYNWVQTSGISVTIENSDSLNASFQSFDINQEEIMSFEITVNDNYGGDNSFTTDSIDITIKPYDVIFNLPAAIGNGCEFNTEIIDTYAVGIDSISWQVLSDTSELIVEGDAIESSITITIPDSGGYSLSATTIFTNGLTALTNEVLVVNKALPKDIKSIEYVISSDESQVVCQDVNIWNDATLKLEEGASLSSIDGSSKRILMWGDVNILGSETNRISVSNVVFENDFFTTNSTISVNASYVDFLNEATILNDDGITNISYSTFDSHFKQSDKGTVIYNVFNKGVSTKPDGTIIKHNDIYCEGLSSCMYVSNYMFGSGFLNAKPTIEYNNIFDAANDSITYNNDSFTETDIDLRNNYWGGKALSELNDVFVDANDTPDKSHLFLFDPMLEDEVDHSNTAPIANAGIDKTTVLNYGIAINGALSSDINGDELSYQWTLLNKPNGSVTTLNNDTDLVSLLTPDTLGTYTIELKVSDGILESIDTMIISVLEDYTITYAPVTPGVTVSMCGISGSGTFGGYYWTFSNCVPYGNAGNPVGVKITNNHPDESIIITQVGIELANGGIIQPHNINPTSQVVAPNSLMYFKIDMSLGGSLTGGFFQLNGVAGYSYGVQATNTFSQ
ncbi:MULTISPECIES: PKD domain-containing protein [unclassified Colwellia]|uniref:PKD domain-containing protein n=1 Tax=unclassified Colwellia TaxID=196834 RepID=UPI0015F35ED2|nr:MULTISPECIES: hypothetical protein [unclassified Colwellia]MBA6377604.1 hypothetical protein [Colwellia sp. BRX10-7]MBA6385272.1 hypothetical protein [Colwellia sp. BRX10-2]MBA6401744.1 hypothetical protein [Colwellia sp. BRX10-5]MBA6404232.1 hypothetical protein [Colwellia sp. BRX10-1]